MPLAGAGDFSAERDDSAGVAGDFDRPADDGAADLAAVSDRGGAAGDGEGGAEEW